MDKLQWTLKPLCTHKEKDITCEYHEQVILHDINDYPFALAFIDSFYVEKDNNRVHDLLRQGIEVTVSLEIVSG